MTLVSYTPAIPSTHSHPINRCTEAFLGRADGGEHCEKRLTDNFLKLSNALAYGTRRKREHIRSLFHPPSPGDGNESLEKGKSSGHTLNLAQLN